ncbi:MAG TPA: asparaginase [Ideonella sp.]|uniref:asparaginase n=1 Tax=Ideonella sp. TaxID=1929293 RepID=UPI002C4100D4|nr:asparaginase [Ideonella sp.]HSI47878.1 asparaginase [Ideonella sp.]
MQNESVAARHVVLLGTGGTIAGQAGRADDNVGYTAGQIGVAQLLAAVPALSHFSLQAEQLVQLDSKDMTHAVWQQLALAVERHLARPDVAGIVITHGTDTLEETAWFLQRTLAPTKPVVLTAAMRPATALLADGPQNLLDAVAVATTPGVRGVLAVLAGRVHGALDVRKWHGYRVDAFSSGDAGPLALVEEGTLKPLRPWPVDEALPTRWQAPVAEWPRVEIVASHAGSDGTLVEALIALGCRGLVVQGTGNGTVHQSLELALRKAIAQGVAVLRTSRCLGGGVVGAPADALPSAAQLTPAKARVELLLRLLVGEGAGA